MAKYSNTVEYNIKTNLDASGIAKLNTQLRQVEAELQRLQGRGVLSDSQVKKDLENINQIKTALASAFNPKLGMLDTQKFMAGLTAGGKSLQAYANTFNSLGTKGAQAFASWYGQLGKIDTGMRQISKTGDKIMNTLGNTVRWGLIASAFSSVMNAAHQSVQYVKDLDQSLTNIMMVSGESRDNMNEFAKAANEVAIRLGGTTTQMTEATKVFVQQGMSLPQSSQMAEYAVHLANISEQDSATTSDELTAMKNAFHLEIDDMGNAVSKWAAIANNAAVSMEELSIASQKAASVANTVGVDMDQFAGHIAAIEATTREAPENIGNGLKTLYSRIADVKLGNTLEDGVNYGQFSSALKKVGVDVLDVTGEMKDAGTIMEEIMAVWNELSQTQQNALATTVAGRFQLARFEALMNSQDIYKNAVSVARAETGTETYDRMQDTYRESLAGRSKALEAEVERIFLNAFNTDSFYGLIDATTALTHTFGDLVEAIGGGGPVITAFFGLLTKFMSGNISRGLANFSTNRQRDSLIESNIAAARTNAQEQIAGRGLNLKDSDAQRMVNNIAGQAQYAHIMNSEQLAAFNKNVEQGTQLLGQLKQAEGEAGVAIEGLNTAFAATGVGLEAAERGTLAFLEILRDAGVEITKEDIAAAGLSQTIGNLGASQAGLHQLAVATEEVATAQQLLREAEKTGNVGQIAAAENMRTEAMEQQVKVAKELGVALSTLAKDSNLSAEAQSKLKTVLAAVREVEQGNWQDIEKLSAAIKDSQLSVNFLVEALSKLKNEGAITQETFVELTGNVEAARQAMEAWQTSGQINQAQLKTQFNIDNVVQMTSAVAQLTFAWSAFKNLGSLWADSEMDLGQKVEETMLNLAMTIPMLLMGFSQLKTAVGQVDFSAAAANLQKYSNEQKSVSAANKLMAQSEKEAAAGKNTSAIASRNKAIAENADAAAAYKSGTASQVAAIKYGIQGAAASAAAVGVRALGAAMNFLAGPGGIALMIGLTAATTIMSALGQQAEEAKQKQQELWDEAKTSFSTIQEGQKNLENLYSEYETSGEASDEFKQALLDQAEALGIAGAEVDVALGKYGDLKQKLDEATASQLAYNASLIQDEVKNAEQAFASEDVSSNLQKDAGLTLEPVKQTDFTPEGLAVEYEIMQSSEGAYEKLLAYQKSSQELQQDIIESKKEENRITKDTSLSEQEKGTLLQEQVKHTAELEAKKKEYDQALSSDSAKTILDSTNQLIDYQKSTALQDEDVLNAKSVEEVEELLKSGVFGPELGAYINNLEETQGAEAAKAYVAGFVQEMINSGKGEISEAMLQDYTGEGKQAGANYTSSVINRKDTIREDAGFEDDADFEQYKQNFTELGGAGVSEGDINTVREYIEATKEEIESQDALCEQLEKEKESLRDVNGNIDESSDAYKDWNKKMQDAEKTLRTSEKKLDDQEETLERLALAAMETNTGIEELSSGWKNWQEALDSGDLNESSKAIAEIGTSLEKALNLDPGTLPTEYVQEHLDEIQRLAEGDTTVLDDLRQSASEAIVQDVILNDEEFTGDAAALESYVAQAQAMLPDLEVGATVDDGPFIAGLTSMLQNAEITEGSLGRIFEAMGYDVHVDYVPANIPNFEWTAVSTGNSIVDSVLNGAGGLIASVTGAVAGSTSMQVPQVTLTKKGGGSSPTIGPSSHGGGGGGGGSCFIAGTLVTLQNSFKEIEKVRKGDIVLSYNEELKQNEYSEVLETMIHITREELYTLHIEDETLTATGIHRFLIRRDNKEEWIPASELQINDLVLFADYSWHKITQIDVEVKSIVVYNFEVSNTHNYYVGRNQILAHNKGKGKGGGGKGKEPKETNRAKSAEVENDIYQKVNATLKKMNDEYSKLDKITERIYGTARRKNVNDQLKLIAKENEETKERVKIAQAYLKALQSGKSNSAYGINMKNKPSLKSTGLVDKDNNGVIDNYVQKFEEARKAAQSLDKIADSYYTNLGGKINKKTGEVIKEAKMTEKQQKEYEKLAKNAERAWKKAEDINTVQKEYEDTWSQIREDEEQMLEYQQQMEDLMIDLYHTALDAADAIKDIKDTSAELKGLWSGFASDSPFRALIEDAQKLQDIMSATDNEFDSYIDDAVKVLEQELKAVKGDKDKEAAYRESIQWYKNKKTEYNTNDIGKGELGMATLQLEEMSRWMEAVKNGELNGLPADSPYRTNTKQLIEDYEEQYKKVAELTLEAEARTEKMHKDILEAYEESADRVEKILNRYDKIQKELDRTADRVALWQGDDAFKAQADILKKKAETAKSMIESEAAIAETLIKKAEAARKKEDAQRKKIQETTAAEIKRLEEELSATSSEDKRLELEQQLEAERVKNMRAQQDIYSEETEFLIEQADEAWEKIKDMQDEAAEAMKDAYMSTIKEIDAQMTESLFGDRNLENITNDWQWDKDYYGKYKDDVEKTYEIEKLRLKYLDLLDDSQNRSLATQRRIRQAMDEQLDLLEHQGTMSEYDVKLANARLEILQKQLALEDARQNKNQMKLRRDTQGNYKYVYAANEEDVKEKQSDLMDEEFNAYEISKEANRDALDNVITLWNQYLEQKAALSQKYYNDTNKLKEELTKLADNFTLAMEANKEDLDDSWNGMILSLEWMVTTGTEDLATMAQDVMDNLDVTNQEAMEKMGYAWSTTIYDVGTKLNKLEEQVKEGTRETIAAQEELSNFIMGPEGIGQVTKDQYGQAEEAIKKTTDATKELQKETDLLNNTLNQELKATSAAEKKIQEYEAQLESAKQATSALRSKIDSAEQSLIEQKQQTEKYKTKYETALAEAAEDKRLLRGNFKAGDTFKIKAGTIVKFGRGGRQQNNEGEVEWKTNKDYTVQVDNPDQKVLKDGKPTSETAKYHVGFHVIDKGWNYIRDTEPPHVGDRIHEQWHLDPASLASAIKLDTGGYTGDWSNSEGKAAILHEKELVLNKTDTKNILTAVQLVRDTVSQLKAGSVTDVFRSISNTSAYTGNTVEQKISITAEFPSANSADEIKQALLSLADSAVQYAYKER